MSSRYSPNKNLIKTTSIKSKEHIIFGKLRQGALRLGFSSYSAELCLRSEGSLSVVTAVLQLGDGDISVPATCGLSFVDTWLSSDLLS